MTKKIARMLIALGLIAITTAGSARDDNWRRPAAASSPAREATNSMPQSGEGAGPARVCTMGGYIRWSCRGDQVCGNTAGSCR